MTHAATAARLPANPRNPRSRAVFAGGGRCWVRTNVGCADGFTDPAPQGYELRKHRPEAGPGNVSGMRIDALPPSAEPTAVQPLPDKNAASNTMPAAWWKACVGQLRGALPTSPEC